MRLKCSQQLTLGPENLDQVSVVAQECLLCSVFSESVGTKIWIRIWVLEAALEDSVGVRQEVKQEYKANDI